MREIKFRGKRTDNDEWAYGDLFRNFDVGSFQTYIRQPHDEIGIFAYEDYFVIPETVGQFTGLTDKNGNEIYEGDVLKYTLDDDEEDTVAKLEFSIPDGAWVLCNNNLFIDETFTDESAENSFVIGNIHDNPQLCEAISN
jgi:uncharacterized phage protein (TIGR01671 family)